MKIFTTMASTHVHKWGYQEGIREIMQNALDSHDRGHEIGVTYLRDKKRLMIFNRGAVLERKSILLGSTTKADDDTQRGQHGEGYKLGSLALVRAGKPVTIFNGEEKWECVLESNPEFDNEKVLTFDISKHSIWKTFRDKLVFEVNNITPEEWGAMNMVFLNLYGPEKKGMLSHPDGTVFMDKNLKGRIYCGGIFVDCDKDLKYGYDFKPSVLELHRDRNAVNSFDLRWNTSKAWAFLSASKAGKLFDTVSMLKSGDADVEYMKEFADYTVKGKVVDDFLKDNTPRSYPVSSDIEAREVKRLGYDPVYASSSYCGVVRDKLGSIEDLKRTVELDYTLFQHITPIDDANIQWVFEVMHKIDDKFKFTLKIAKFALDTSRSISEGTVIVINSNLITCKFEVLHEVVRHYSGVSKKQESLIWKELFKNVVNTVKGDK